MTVYNYLKIFVKKQNNVNSAYICSLDNPHPSCVLVNEASNKLASYQWNSFEPAYCPCTTCILFTDRSLICCMWACSCLFKSCKLFGLSWLRCMCSSHPFPLLPSESHSGVQLVCFALLLEFRLQSQNRPWLFVSGDEGGVRGKGVNASRTAVHDKDRPHSGSVGIQIECSSPASAPAPSCSPPHISKLYKLHIHAGIIFPLLSLCVILDPGLCFVLLFVQYCCVVC